MPSPACAARPPVGQRGRRVRAAIDRTIRPGDSCVRLVGYVRGRVGGTAGRPNARTRRRCDTSRRRLNVPRALSGPARQPARRIASISFPWPTLEPRIPRSTAVPIKECRAKAVERIFVTIAEAGVGIDGRAREEHLPALPEMPRSPGRPGVPSSPSNRHALSGREPDHDGTEPTFTVRDAQRPGATQGISSFGASAPPMDGALSRDCWGWQAVADNIERCREVASARR